MSALLAGPIVRRADPRCVYLWCATLGIDRLSAALYDMPLPPSPPVGIRRGRTRRFESVELGRAGLRLHLLPIEPIDQPFPTDRVLAYDVVAGNLPDDDAAVARGSLVRRLRLGYGGFELPWIALRDKGAIDVLHGSCRKAHGPGRDAMTRADELLVQAGHDVAARPSALYLTGDQIYADDVETELARWLFAAAPARLGLDEELLYPAHGAPPEPHAKHRPLKATRRLASRIPADQRGDIVAGVLSSTHATSHLLSFGEFAAMYLFAWGGGAADWGPIGAPPASAGDEARTHAALRARFTEHIPAARRVLANLPTYMMADDHEVTDDWSLNPAWAFRTEHHPLSRQVLLNAIAAFGLFQAWGNDPRPGDLELFRRVAAWASTVHRKLDDPICEQLLDRYWGFTTAMRPRTLFLDTRSHRAPSRMRGEAPPFLVEGGVLAKALDGYKQQLERDAPPIIVSPVPLIGLLTLDEAQALISAALGPYELDFESWAANAGGFCLVKEAFARAFPEQTVLVLSGDVHYAYVAEETFEVPRGARVKTRFVQFTSSALDNSGFSLAVVEGFRRFSPAPLRKVLGTARDVGVIRKPTADDYAKARDRAERRTSRLGRELLTRRSLQERLREASAAALRKLIRSAHAMLAKHAGEPLEVLLDGAPGHAFDYVTRTRYPRSKQIDEPSITFFCSIGRFQISDGKLVMSIIATPPETLPSSAPATSAPASAPALPDQPLRTVEVDWREKV